jgi:hypothetical protein
MVDVPVVFCAGTVDAVLFELLLLWWSRLPTRSAMRSDAKTMRTAATAARLRRTRLETGRRGDADGCTGSDGSAPFPLLRVQGHRSDPTDL